MSKRSNASLPSCFGAGYFERGRVNIEADWRACFAEKFAARPDQSVYIIRLVLWRIAVTNMDVTETTGEQLRVGISLEELQIVKAALNECATG